MHGLPNSIELSFFDGRRLEQLRIGEHQIELVFGEDVSVSVEAAISLEGERREDLRAAGKELTDLLGCELAGAKRRGRGDLMLLFANGRRVVIHDSNEAYESYTITKPGGLVVV